MAWSYVGLLAAFVSEAVTRLPAAQAGGAPGAPGAAFGAAVAVGTFAVVGVGAWMIRARAVATLKPFQPRSAD